MRGLNAEAMNKKIALDFISELRDNKTGGEGAMEIKNRSDNVESDIKLDFKPKFKPSNKKVICESEAPSSSLFQSSHGGKARVMDTFEFGTREKISQKSKKHPLVTSTAIETETKPKTKTKISSSVKLLNYYEDEDEEE